MIDVVPIAFPLVVGFLLCTLNVSIVMQEIKKDFPNVAFDLPVGRK